MPRLYCELYRSVLAGGLTTARSLQDYANRVIAILPRYPAIPAAKEAMRSLGYDSGHCRGPLETLSKEQPARLHHELSEVNFFERDFGL